MKITTKTLYDKKKIGRKITALTAYDFPFAKMLDESGIDVVLVGDSLGMVLLGYETTLPVTMDDMLHHTKAASRAVKKSLLIGDMPYGSYKTAADAVRNAKRFTKEAQTDGVKLEGGRRIEKQIRALIQARIPVMGHLGMTPQSVEKFGGYKVQGKTDAAAEEILKDAQLLEKLGVFSIVLECIPAELGKKISQQIKCPTIGIGAGPHTDGQILVLHDMLGFESHVHPRFVRRYGAVEKEARKAIASYRDDVLAGKFPSKKESY